MNRTLFVCSCGCEHLLMRLVGGTVELEFEECGCPRWMRHVLVSPDDAPFCCGTTSRGEPCRLPAMPGSHLCEGHHAAVKWDYREWRAREFAGHEDPMTFKQRRYLESLIATHPVEAREIEQAINAFFQLWPVPLLGATKGEAIFVISRLSSLGAR